MSKSDTRKVGPKTLPGGDLAVHWVGALNGEIVCGYAIEHRIQWSHLRGNVTCPICRKAAGLEVEVKKAAKKGRTR